MIIALLNANNIHLALWAAQARIWTIQLFSPFCLLDADGEVIWMGRKNEEIKEETWASSEFSADH